MRPRSPTSSATSERGLVDPAEAENARVEAARRLLAAARRREAPDAAMADESFRRRAVGHRLLAYRRSADQPPALFGRRPAPTCRPSPLRRASRRRRDGTWSSPRRWRRSRSTSPPTRTTARGYEVVSPVYMQMGRFSDEVRGYSTAIRTLGETAQRLENLGEAQVAAADGIVTADARIVIDRALAK